MLRAAPATLLPATFLMAALIAFPAVSQARTPAAPSPLITALDGCRKLTDDRQRLACFDQAAASLVSATQAGDVSVVDRGQIREARRSLFGFGSLRVPFLSGNGDEDTGELKSTVRSARALGNGRFRIVIADGDATWETTESYATFDDPEPGQPIVIRRGSLGSYVLRVDNQRGVRGHRVN